jgi:glycosyltransferase involved in cell wall biosynthesis
VRAIVHIIGRFLGRSETFIYDMVTRVGGFEHHVLTTRTENADLFPFPRLVVVGSEEEYTRHVQRLRAAAIVCHFGPAGMAGIVPGLALGVPVVTIFHGYDASMLLRDAAWVERYQALFRFGSHVIGVSDEIRRRLVRIGCPPHRASVIRLGIDLTRFVFVDRRRRGVDDPLRLLVVARLTPKKGIPVVLRAVRHVLDRSMDVSLRIAGEGEEHAALTTLCRQLGLERHVSFVGPLDREGVRREMASSDLLLQTSVVAETGDEEGIPVVLMEAMASGLPVIASRHSGIPELVDHERTGLLVPEGDDRATADAIVRLATDASLARRLAASGRDCVRAQFNLDKQAERYGALFKRVIAEYQPGERPGPAAGKRKRMLFIRTVPTPIALSKLIVLHHRYPDVDFWVLTREDSREVFRRCPLVSRVLTFPSGRMSVESMPTEVRTAIRSTGFERVFVPLADDPRGYDNVLHVTAACGAGPVVGLGPRNEEVPLAAPPPEGVSGSASEPGGGGRTIPQAPS